ncbi:hypothetical protein D9758_014383 [Tetrapyrgos nigripes]|uniref:Aldos-2-ulose dehydratase/isomerase (AUDH) Cupin domain-containing protein n=1 Tax=Tetrapyrgos nigripes TaxID=182062 RepID=A0A8H5CTA8_9AGAR|nr:hypothetical protein D9758_014383 [Tetrapyrgos nigripes]
MCCTCRALSAAPDVDSNNEHVNEIPIATPLPDGYWIEAFPFKTDASTPDIIAYGLGFKGKPAAIKLLTNPINTSSGGWKVNEITSLDFPVGMTYADLTGDGYNDVIICDRYGPSMDDLWSAETNDGGRIQWLRNPGDRSAPDSWEAHSIGNSTGMHRIQAGHFTTAEHVQVMGLPIIPKSSDLTSPAPILIFTPVYGSDDHKKGPDRWTKDVAFASQFRLIHDVRLLPRSNGNLDSILVAGREGIALLWYDTAKKSWQHNIVGTGLPQSGENPYWGSGSVDVCRIGDEQIGYIATCEGFHGNSVAVYLRKPNAPKGVEALKDSSHWERKVIQSFGELNAKYTGTIHHIKAVQTPTTHVVESFAIACMGAQRNQGVYVYTPEEKDGNITSEFRETKVTNESAGRLAIGNFSHPSDKVIYFADFENHTYLPIQEIASISYYVPNYHTGPDPPAVRINTISPQNLNIVVSRLNNEVLLRIPRPNAIPPGENRSLPFWILAGRKIKLVVVPPCGEYRLAQCDAVKVIYGSITYDVNGAQITRGIAPAAKDIGETQVPSIINAGDKGAVFIHLEPLSDHAQGPFQTMSEVSSLNILPNNPHVDPSARTLQLPFRKVETLSWAQNGLWDNFEFYNVTGFHIHFNDDSFERIVHTQAWTLGLGETARFHNHSDQSFCEIHYCLSNGGGKGGMRYFADDYTDPIDTDAELTKEYVEKNSTLLVVPDMHEHGPLWKIQQGNQAKPKLRPNGTVDYPWHAWLASQFGDRKLPIIPPLPANEQKYDVWMAFEFPLTAFQY